MAKTITAARIELDLWFPCESAYQRFAAVPLGRKSQSVSDRDWSSVYAFSDGHIEGKYRFTHTCRNDGAHNSDSRRFVRGVRKAAQLGDQEAVLTNVTLIDREKFTEPSPTETQSQPRVAVVDRPAVLSATERAYMALRFDMDHEYNLYGVAADR